MNWMPVLAPRTILVPSPGVQGRLGSSPGRPFRAPRAVLAQQGRLGASPGAPGLDALGGKGREDTEWKDWERRKGGMEGREELDDCHVP